MSSTFIIEQSLAALQLGVTLFLMASGLTLTFGVMGLTNLSHGSIFMFGAYAAAVATNSFGSFFLGAIIGIAAAGLLGVIIEILVLRSLYERDHLYQVLATFGLILVINDGTSLAFGKQPIMFQLPSLLAGSIEIVQGLTYPTYRLLVIVVGLLVSAVLYFLISHTRLGMTIRAGSTHRVMIGAFGINIKLLFTLVFALGCMFAGLAGTLTGPLSGIQIGMGDNIIVVTFVVIVIGGIGSIKGALLGSLLVASIDTMARVFLPAAMVKLASPLYASTISAALSSMSIYVLMAVTLIVRPKGIFSEPR
jgi:branched-chain amino acid transport system permease protein